MGLLSDLHAAPPGTVAGWHNRYDFDGLADRIDAALEWFDQQGVDVVAVTGDLCHHGQPDALDAVLSHLAGAGMPTLHVLGNHDGAGGPGGRRAPTGPHVAAGRPVPIAGVAVCGVPVEGGEGWFGARVRVPEALEQATGRPLVVLSHFPLLSFADDVARQGLAYPGDAIGRAAVLAALRSREAPSIVLSGHIHARAARSAGAVLQLVSAPLVEPPYDAAIVSVEPLQDSAVLVRRHVRSLPGPAATGPIPSLTDSDMWLYRGGAWTAQLEPMRDTLASSTTGGTP